MCWCTLCFWVCTLWRWWWWLWCGVCGEWGRSGGRQGPHPDSGSRQIHDYLEFELTIHVYTWPTSVFNEYALLFHHFNYILMNKLKLILHVWALPRAIHYITKISLHVDYTSGMCVPSRQPWALAEEEKLHKTLPTVTRWAYKVQVYRY